MSDYYATAEAALPLFRLARRHGPETSRSAAARTTRFASGHRAAILAALAAGPAGQTEIAARAGMTVAAVSKRLHELRKAGAIVRTGEAVSPSGGRETVYRRAEACQ